MTNIPYARQNINDDDISSVIEALRSDFLTQGPLVSKFEEDISRYCGVKHTVASNSATSALHIACMALEINSKSLVWTSPISYVASSNCALYCGASVDFVDIDPKTNNISVKALEEKLIIAKKNNQLPDVLIPVHLSGYPCEMDLIFELSKKYGFLIIEDASHAIGSKYLGENIGSCKFSDITILSFHPVKIITTGEGGAATTNDKNLAKKMISFRSHGILPGVSEEKVVKDHEIWNYQQLYLGFNYRMTDIQAALGISQLKRLDNFVKKRNILAVNYYELLSDLPVLTPARNETIYSAFHLYIIRLKRNLIKKNQKEIYEEMKFLGINLNLHYIPIYLQPFYSNLGFKRGHCPEAEKYFIEALSFPMYFDLSFEDQKKIVTNFKKVIKL